MNKLLWLGFFLLLALSSCEKKKRFEIKEGSFLLDGKNVQLVCGEMHYPRIPKEYWRDRMKRAKAMGLNTISAYVFWNFHERTPGNFDFEGQADLAEFVRTAQEEGLFVLLRPGPYICGEWDFGGYPSWLLKEKDLVLRSNNEKFMSACEKYIHKLGEELAPLTIENGGPIILVQVENEYGSYSDDKEYLGRLRDIIKAAGFDVPLITCDGAGQMSAGYVDGTLPTVNGAVGEDIKTTIDKFQPGGPYFVAEFYPAWFDVWGTHHSYRDYKNPTAQLDWMIKNGVSVSIYMFHGGTNFEYTNGANTSYGYAPQPTSYDYDAPLGEYGNAYPKYYAFREVLQKYLPEGEKLPEVPVENPLISFPEITLTEAAELSEAFTERAQSEKVLTMEDLNQDFGYIHYETTLDKPVKGTLVIKDVRDYAVVSVNGKQVGTLDRRHRQSKLDVDIREVPAKLEILVENVGRVNYGSDIAYNLKGITEKVTLNGEELKNWTVSPLPLYKADMSGYKFDNQDINNKPAFFRGSFDLAEVGDCFIDTRGWGKGAVWVNGHSLGKYWNIGPQQTLYLPAPWLKQGKNEIVVFEMEDTGHRTIQGLNRPILDELGVDKNVKERVKRDNSKTPTLDKGDLILKAQIEKNADWQTFKLDHPVTLRHLCFESLNSYDEQFSCISEIELLDKDGNIVPKDRWSIVYANTEEQANNEGYADNMIDDNLNTYWHSQWRGTKTAFPHQVIIDLGEITAVTGFKVHLRNPGMAGCVKDFQLYGRPQFFLFK